MAKQGNPKVFRTDSRPKPRPMKKSDSAPVREDSYLTTLVENDTNQVIRRISKNIQNTLMLGNKVTGPGR